MKSVMESLSQVEKNEVFQILSRVSLNKIEISFKAHESEKIYKTTLDRNSARKQFYLSNQDLDFDVKLEVTFKIIVDRKLYFLKTNLKRGSLQYFFENTDNFFELVRRKKPRFEVPEHWAQSAKVQGFDNPVEIKSPVTIIDLSRTGMRVLIRSELPRYEKNQIVNLYFKIHRRAEIVVKSKIIYLENKLGTGPVVGLEYADSSILITNKIQNVCDDLAFYWTAES
ncbi:MAG: PilZ domain-containing protein [Pseudobdellovibrio sp.]